MSALKYLLFIKWKAFVRNIWSRPLSAAFTLLAIVIFIVTAFITIRFSNATGMLQYIGGIENFIMGILGYTALFFLLTLVQRRTAIIDRTDAFYILGRPFTRRQILAFILFDMTRGCVLYTLLIAFTFSIICASFHIPMWIFLLSTVGYFFLIYILFAGNALFYLLEIADKHGKKIKYVTVGILLLIASVILFLNVAEHDYAGREGLKAFMGDKRFYLIPFFGWMKCLMISAVTGDQTGIITSLSLLIITALIITFFVLQVKGDFYERAMEDAEWFTKTREAAKSGRDISIETKKIGNAGRFQFRGGAWAVTSKTILEMKKANNWVRKQELFLIGFYLIFAKLSSQSYIGFQSLVMIVVFISTSSDTIKSELKTHYIYLIPDKPINKIFSIAAPAMLKAFLIILCSVIPAAFLFQLSIWDALYSILTLTGYSAVFVAGNIWSIKVLKSGSNPLAEQLMKFLIILAGCIPSIVITIILNIVLYSTEYLARTVSFVSIGMNLVVGLLFIGMARGIFYRGKDMIK